MGASTPKREMIDNIFCADRAHHPLVKRAMRVARTSAQITISGVEIEGEDADQKRIPRTLRRAGEVEE